MVFLKVKHFQVSCIEALVLGDSVGDLDKRERDGTKVSTVAGLGMAYGLHVKPQTMWSPLDFLSAVAVYQVYCLY